MRNILSNIFPRLEKGSKSSYVGARAGNYYQSFYNAIGKPVWSGRNYAKFSDEGFIKNVIAHRAVNIIASAAASVP